ncbi:outer membrane beta-barrel protein [Thalassospira marina]|uniref:outer membrane beta-barrel protein n=1 Tax=Thalassospira marina TaxID=2048283 RepID=UPI0012FF3C9C|nr:outer membrane beta-barrel protein [Thalassospira marina]
MKFLKGGLLASVAVGALAVVLPAAAQETVNPDQAVTQRAPEGYEPNGITVGSFRLYPKVEAAEEYNDNIYKSNTNETDDYITKISPGLQLRSNWNRHFLQFEASSEFGIYADTNDNDYADYNLRATGRADATEALKFNGDARMQHLHEDRGGDDVATDAKEPVEYDKLTGVIGGTYKPNRFSVGLTGTVDDYDYDDNSTIGGGTDNNDDRDRTETKGEVRFGYEIQTGYEAFIKSSVNERDYDSNVDDGGVNRDSSGYKVQAGIAIDLDRLIRADLGVGWMEQDYDDQSLKDVDGYSADARIRWNITELTTLRATASRTINETTTTGASSTIGTAVGLGVDHELLRNLILNADAKYYNSDYQGISREDDKYTYSIGADYKLNRNLFGGIKLTHETRDSTNTVNEYDQNVIMVKVGGQF